MDAIARCTQTSQLVGAGISIIVEAFREKLASEAFDFEGALLIVAVAHC